MNIKSAKQTGLYYLAFLTLFLFISELAFRHIVGIEIEEIVIKILIIGVPFIFVFLGHKWAKWFAAFILILNGTISLYGAFQLDSQGLYIVGLFNMFFAVVLHTSKKIKPYFLNNEVPNQSHDEPLMGSLINYNYPYLLTRIKAALIDGLILFGILAAFMILTTSPENRPTSFIAYIVFTLLYEPIMLSAFAGTIGHMIMDIRVKNHQNTSKNIKFYQGVIRILSKAVLGWLSFLTINFNPEHRAIHDYLSSSIVLNNQKD
jgi:uncharacterized RDD family membrane protein YckC